MKNHSKEELKEKRKLLPRMTAQQKKEMLSFLDGDEASVEIGKQMIKSYLETYPKELHFKKKFMAKLRALDPYRRIYNEYWNTDITDIEWLEAYKEKKLTKLTVTEFKKQFKNQHKILWKK